MEQYQKKAFVQHIAGLAFDFKILDADRHKLIEIELVVNFLEVSTESFVDYATKQQTFHCRL